MIYIKSKEEINKIERACRIVSEILEALRGEVRAGITTEYLDELAQLLATKRKVNLAFRGYRGFPKGICVSINDEVVHGIPSSRVIKEGDIVSIDVGICAEGYYGDGAVTVGVNGITEEAHQLISVTEACLYKGIEKAVVGNRLSDISHAIQTYAEAHHFSVIRDLTGHGIGKNLHEEPQVPNFGLPHNGPLLREGMVLAIEPMVSQGKWEVEIQSNGWTVVTRDHSLSAHFEHTVLIDCSGPRILTSLD